MLQHTCSSQYRSCHSISRAAPEPWRRLAMPMLMRTDPFREFDRLTQQVFGNGTTSRPVVMPMDAWREGDSFVLEFDLPGIHPDSLDIDVERNVLTIKAERPARNGD